jgi:hypothetical protein
MKPAEFVTRLKAIQFENDLRLLESAENSFRTSMAAYKGYDALATAFTRFFLDTISVYNRDIVPAVTEAVSAEHNQLIEKLVRAFVTLRAARITAHSGYPLQGFTLLRNIYDDCVLASAAMQGLTNFVELAGVKPGEDFDPARCRKNRSAVERAVRAKMEDNDSGSRAPSPAICRSSGQLNSSLSSISTLPRHLELPSHHPSWSAQTR